MTDPVVLGFRQQVLSTAFPANAIECAHHCIRIWPPAQPGRASAPWRAGGRLAAPGCRRWVLEAIGTTRCRLRVSSTVRDFICPGRQKSVTMPRQRICGSAGSASGFSPSCRSSSQDLFLARASTAGSAASSSRPPVRAAPGLFQTLVEKSPRASRKIPAYLRKAAQMTCLAFKPRPFPQHVPEREVGCVMLCLYYASASWPARRTGEGGDPAADGGWQFRVLAVQCRRHDAFRATLGVALAGVPSADEHLGLLSRGALRADDRY
jgi:hypothetical protein